MVTPVSQTLHFKTQMKVPKVGVMLVGLGGNNGSTVAAGILANKHGLTWNTKASRSCRGAGAEWEEAVEGDGGIWRLFFLYVETISVVSSVPRALPDRGGHWESLPSIRPCIVSPQGSTPYIRRTRSRV